MIGVKFSGTNPEAGYGSVGGVATTATWDFDIAGNRTAQVINSATTSYTVNDINQYTMVDSGSLTYNTRGDLLTHGDWTLAYNAFGHLISATGTSAEVHKYYYDAGGTRVGKQLHGEDPVFFFHVGFDRIEDIDAANGDVTSYISEPGIDRPLAMISASGDITFFHQDVLGNVVALTSETGTLVQQYRYTVWGEPQVFDATNQQLATNNATSPFLFIAREYDVETGLYHYRARAYSPQLGRFLQFDPIDFGGGDGNIYRYVSNAPFFYTDPMGKFPWHGKYCGANWTNGGNEREQFPPDGNPRPDQIGPDAGGPDAWDAVDACCIQHDKDYAACKHDRCKKDKEWLRKCKRKADDKLLKCLSGAYGGTQPLYWPKIPLTQLPFLFTNQPSGPGTPKAGNPNRH